MPKTTVDNVDHFYAEHPLQWVTVFPPMTGYQMICCDCGLVHTLNFTAVEIIKENKETNEAEVIELSRDRYQVIMKIRRNKKLTLKVRKMENENG
jgi:hypothetical protein